MDEKPTEAICQLCGEPMPAGEEMFNFHDYSDPCPKPPLPKSKVQSGNCPRHDIAWIGLVACPICQDERDAAIRERDEALDALDEVVRPRILPFHDKAEEVLTKHGRLPKEG